MVMSLVVWKCKKSYSNPFVPNFGRIWLFYFRAMKSIHKVITRLAGQIKEVIVFLRNSHGCEQFVTVYFKVELI